MADIEGDVAECRTRLTSLVALSDHRSTVRTKYDVSISLEEAFEFSTLCLGGFWPRPEDSIHSLDI